MRVRTKCIFTKIYREKEYKIFLSRKVKILLLEYDKFVLNIFVFTYIELIICLFRNNVRGDFWTAICPYGKVHVGESCF